VITEAGFIEDDKEVNKRDKKLAALVRINHSIGANLEVEEIARIAVRELTGIVNCDACAILMIADNKVKILAERGFSEIFAGIEFNTDMPAISYILKTKRGIFSGDILNSPAAGCVPQGCSMNSLICIPIILNGEITGIVHLDAARKNAFNQEDLEFSELLAKEISIAMERSLLYSQIKDISTRDGLTGCFNRRKFDVDIVAEIAAAGLDAKSLSLLMLDIDWFKKYNDGHGHPKGDELLKQMVQVFKDTIRPSDRVYRYGGEEFAVLLLNTGKEDAVSVAARIVKAVEREQFEGEKESQPNGKVTVSIGVANYPADANNQEELIKFADSALYKAKQSGRNQVRSFDVEGKPA
jgi:diguanylate cyclase (GGDEF)-like protein